MIMDDVERIASFLMKVDSHTDGHLVSCLRVMLWPSVASQSHPVHFQAVPSCCGLQRLFVLQYGASSLFSFFYSPHLLLLCDVFMPIEQHVGDWNLDFNKVSGLIHTYAWWWWVIKILWIVIILYFIHLVLCLGIYGLILFENTYVQGFFFSKQ